MIQRRLAALLVFCLLSVPASAGEPQAGTLAELQGEVKLLTHPGKTVQGPAPHVLFEGNYYSVQDAKAGMKVARGNVLRTAIGGKVKVLFENGDQFYVGSGTAYKVNWTEGGQGGKKPEINLMYGKIRGVVEKGGPRSGLRIRTSSATMGVRGTDFFHRRQRAGGRDPGFRASGIGGGQARGGQARGGQA
jgi:hypothetical protein